MAACHGFPRRATTLALAVTASVVLLLTLAIRPTSADPRDDKRRADAEVGHASEVLEGATARAAAAARKFYAVTAELPGAQARVAETRGRVVAATVSANTARREADRARAAYDAATRDYRESMRRVVEARERVGRFVAATYKGGDIVSLNVLLGARSAEDFTQRSGYVDRILTEEHTAIGRLLDARTAARRHQLDAETARRQADRAAARARSALDAAHAAERQAVAARAALTRLAAARAATLAVARQERAVSLARFQQARQRAARIAAELRAWQSRHRGRHGGPVLHPGARFIMPVHGWKSSDFGMRFDPFFQVWQLHAGVDLAADGGSPIFAAASGRVIRAGWEGGYGNYTCIGHGTYLGKGLSTCYAHQSRIDVSPGQWVRQGEVIGRVGTTGASTGNHLHFEVRLDGEPKQPLGWLPNCLC